MEHLPICNLFLEANNMHILFCTLALLLCSLSALAQNNHAPTSLGGTPSIFQDTSIFRTSQSRFYLGWHWGGNTPSWQVNKRMNINATQSNSFPKKILSIISSKTSRFRQCARCVNSPLEGCRTATGWNTLLRGSSAEGRRGVLCS